MRTVDLTRKLFGAVDVLRGVMDVATGVRVVSAVLVLKWASEHTHTLTVPDVSRWGRLTASAENSLADALDQAVTALAVSNPDFFGDFFPHIVRDKRIGDLEARNLIAIIDEIPAGGGDYEQDDVAGRLYEQMLARLADDNRHSEFATPYSVIQLMISLANPQAGNSVYDPCAGTGGLLAAAEAFVADRTGQHNALRIFGQEANVETSQVARLNLTLHGLSNVSLLIGNVLTNPGHLSNSGRLEKFDRVVTHPPFGMRYVPEKLAFPEQTRYGHSRSADLMFVQHVLASLATDGTGVIVVPNGALFRGGVEGRIRRGMVQDGVIAAVISIGRNVFPGTSIPACLLVLNSDGTTRANKPDVFFINAEHEVDSTRSRSHLAPRHVEKIATAFSERREIPGFSRWVSVEEIATKEFSLNIGDYVSPVPLTRAKLSINGLLAGEVPIEEVEAQVDRFNAFGIELDELFVPGQPGYLELALRGHDVIAETISALAVPRSTEFVAAVEKWFRKFEQELILLTGRPVAAVREHFAGQFSQALGHTSKILNDEHLAGLFVDWWTANQEDLNQLRRPDGGPGVLTPGTRAAVFNRIGKDLSARARKLVAQQQGQLVDVYRAWSDQYMTSLAELAHRQTKASNRLAERLHDLGYQWPRGG
ncbi:N-6 DNA methylase [Micromonospora zamorensis]|uniref:N-6 DNA methylase n=1 Tax=Micromonospora zamorensis TaxID=709883 RepID=UPI002E17B45B